MTINDHALVRFKFANVILTVENKNISKYRSKFQQSFENGFRRIIKFQGLLTCGISSGFKFINGISVRVFEFNNSFLFDPRVLSWKPQFRYSDCKSLIYKLYYSHQWRIWIFLDRFSSKTVKLALIKCFLNSFFS